MIKTSADYPIFLKMTSQNFSLRILNIALRSLNMTSKFVLLIFIARFLNESTMAEFSLIVAVQIFSIYLLGFDFYVYTTREIVGESKKKISFVLKNHLWMFSIIFFVYVILYFYFYAAFSIDSSIAYLLLIIIFMEYIGTEIFRVFLALQKPVLATFSMFTRSSLWIFIYVFCAFLFEDFRNIYTIILFWLFFLFLNLVLCTTLLVKFGIFFNREKINFSWIKKGLKISIPFFLGTLALKALSTVDRYYLANNDNSALAAYALFFILSSFIQAFLEAGLLSFNLPQLIHLKKIGDLNNFKSLSKKLAIHSFLFLLICALFCPIFIYITLRIINEEYYYDYSSYFYWIYFLNILLSINLLSNTLNYALHLDKSIIHANVIAFFLFLIILTLYPGYPSISILIGALIVSTVFSIVFKSIFFFHWFNRLKSLSI